MAKAPSAYIDDVYWLAKDIEPVILGIVSPYLLNNYRIEISRNWKADYSMFFRWITDVPAYSSMPRSSFSVHISENPPVYDVCVSRKKWDSVMKTDSRAVLTAFLNVYEDYLKEQGLISY